MQELFIPGVASPEVESAQDWWFPIKGNQILVHADAETYQIPTRSSLSQAKLTPIRQQFLGTLNGQSCYSAELPHDTVAPEGMALMGLRNLYGLIDEALYSVCGRAVQIVDWDRTHQFCGRCGNPTAQLDYERAKRCPKCELVNYPRLSPAIIVLVSRGDEVLLARAPRFRNGMYSVLAGFVEPGESLEETVVREVREEVGIEVTNIQYFGSQPWPFPNSLMIGFTATYAGGEIVIEPEELVDAAWFSKHDLPPIPPKPSIARRLLDWFVAQP